MTIELTHLLDIFYLYKWSSKVKCIRYVVHRGRERLAEVYVHVEADNLSSWLFFQGKN